MFIILSRSRQSLVCHKEVS